MENEQNTSQTPVEPALPQPADVATPSQDPTIPTGASGPAPILPSSSSGKPNILVILIAIVAAALLIGGAVFAFTKSDDGKKDESSNNKTEDKKESTNTSNNAVTATSTSDFSAVCTNGSVKNAAAYTEDGKPHKVVALSKKAGRSNFTSESVGYGTEYYVSSDTDLSTVSVVACLEAVDGSEAKSLTCDYEKDGATVNVDLISARYTLTYYSALSGEKIGEGEDINAPATRCPMFLAYDASTMTAQASIDDAALEAEIEKFAL